MGFDWHTLVAEATLAGVAPSEGVLSLPARAAGLDENSRPVKNPQRAFTAQIELSRYDGLDLALKAL